MTGLFHAVRMRLKMLLAVFLGLAAGARMLVAAPGTEELILCGDQEVFVLDVNSGGKKIWSWLAEDHPELPDAVREQFRTTDDCKPVEQGSRILITSSGGGVALVERASGQAVFWASVEDAHSAEMLPRNRVLVAGADANRLALFDLARSGTELATYRLEGAHGLVWDAAASCVWALGYRKLHAYTLKDWETTRPSLVLSVQFDLPDRGGHDLRPLPGTRPRLILTTDNHVWTFDPDSRQFAQFERLGDVQEVKSVDIHSRTGRIAYVKAETSWWSSSVSLLEPAGEIDRPGGRLYKARWGNDTIHRQVGLGEWDGL
jgi:hypothetical protein